MEQRRPVEVKYAERRVTVIEKKIGTQLAVGVSSGVSGLACEAHCRILWNSQRREQKRL
jgi:hypothetical protein